MLTTKEKQFYERIIEFKDYIEVRIIDNSSKYKPISRFAKNIEELTKIFNEFNNKRWNIYVGINTREEKKKTDKFINYRKLFYFDIEHKKDKPSLQDNSYYRKLEKVCVYIIHYLRENYGLRPCVVTISGRGLHLYYKIKPVLNTPESKQMFRSWYKLTQDEIEKDMKKHKVPEIKEIKFKDSVFNASRIASAPGTYHTKYEEMPKRYIKYLNEKHINDINKLLQKFNEPIKNNNVVDDYKINREYDEQTIFQSPEFKIFEYKNLPQGQINQHLRFALKLLMKKNKIKNITEIEQALEQMGKGLKSMDYNDMDENYQYSQRILNNWVKRNYIWAVNNDYKLPYKEKGSKKKSTHQVQIESEEEVDFNLDYKILEYQELIEYIRNFNTQTSVKMPHYTVFYTKAIEERLKKNCVPKLWQFIEMNNLFDKLKFEKHIR